MSTKTRIATLSLNPAIDQTARVSSFTAGRVNRVEWEQADAGGKGVNVASFLADAGLPVVATGLLGNGNVEPFVELFTRKGIADRFVRLPGRTRVNVKIVDRVLDQVTDINFPGLAPRPEDLVTLTETLDALCGDTDWFVLSGSVPAGVPTRMYEDLVRRLKVRGKTVVLDASGAPFADAIGCGPDIIKPNIDELGELVGRPLPEPRRDHRRSPDPDRRRCRSGGGLDGAGRRPVRGVGRRRAGDPARHRGEEHRGGRRRHGGRHRDRHPARAGPGRARPARHRLFARRPR